MIQYTATDGLAVLLLQSPPVNAFSLGLLDELLESVRRACADPDVRAVILTGGPVHFSAGADLALFRDLRGVDDAVRLSQHFQHVFGQIENSFKPVVAALAGHVMGGALELALACHFRVAVEGSRFSTPEVRLGINPGAGGTQRLPRLIGVEAALDMLVSGQAINSQRALELGLVSALCAPDALASCAAAAAGAPIVRTSQRADKLSDAAANRAAFDRAEKLAAAGRPEIVAPAQIIQAVRVGVEQSLSAGLQCEQVAFGDCMATRAAQNRIYLFFATRQAGRLAHKVEPGANESSVPSRLERAGVLGMGTMGTGITLALATAGIAVTGCDESQAALDRALDKIRGSVKGRVRQGKLTAPQAESITGRIQVTTDCQSLAHAQIVIEAIVEDAQAKRAALARLEALCAPDAIVATNTSTLNLDGLAAGMRHPERLVGMHFFHPAHHMPLVEIVHRATTPATVVSAALRTAKTLGKTAVLVRNREGFVVNRLFVPYLKEAFWLLEEGVPPSEIDRAAVDYGFAMGPLALIDMSGLDILMLTDEVLRRAYAWHGPLSAIVERLVARGCLGQKSGAGVYRYESGDRTPRPGDVAHEIIAEVRRERVNMPCAAANESLADRLVLRMIAEAFRVVEEGLVGRPADVDVAMVLGTGLGDFRGGVLKYACDLGLPQVLAQLENLTDRHGQRYAPCQTLHAAAANPAEFRSALVDPLPRSRCGF